MKPKTDSLREIYTVVKPLVRLMGNKLPISGMRAVTSLQFIQILKG